MECVNVICDNYLVENDVDVLCNVKCIIIQTIRMVDELDCQAGIDHHTYHEETKLVMTIIHTMRRPSW